MKIILASGSPRRKEIMTELGYEFEIVKSVKDEITEETEPERVVIDLSLSKALEVADIIREREDTDYIILSADTVVANAGKILGKPAHREEAFSMIKSLQGHGHQVFTGVTILRLSDNAMVNFAEKTDVFVKSMSDEEIAEYVATGESDDKAGAYAIQGIFSKYIEGYEGDYSNVVGLPGKRVKEEIDKLWGFL